MDNQKQKLIIVGRNALRCSLYDANGMLIRGAKYAGNIQLKEETLKVSPLEISSGNYEFLLSDEVIKKAQELAAQDERDAVRNARYFAMTALKADEETVKEKTNELIEFANKSLFDRRLNENLRATDKIRSISQAVQLSHYPSSQLNAGNNIPFGEVLRVIPVAHFYS
jgi:hypothetical protein